MLVLAEFCVLEQHRNHHVLFFGFFIKRWSSKSCIQDTQTFKMLRAGLVLNFAGLGYFALTIPCFVVDPFYCAIEHSLWWQISLVMLFLPILDPLWCSAVTLVAFSSYLNSFNRILIAVVKQYIKYVFVVT